MPHYRPKVLCQSMSKNKQYRICYVRAEYITDCDKYGLKQCPKVCRLFFDKLEDKVQGEK